MGADTVTIAMLFIVVVLLCVALYFYWLSIRREKIVISRAQENPILSPIPEHWWESEAVFNPAAVVHNGKVHLFYRALGRDGLSRIGYASSADGVHFERLPYPVYDMGAGAAVRNKPRYAPLSYNTDSYASGGGWGGLEDPRAVTIDENMFLTMSVFEGWQSIRQAVTSLALSDLEAKNFDWMPHFPISPAGETHKNWVLFPERIQGRFAIMHQLTPDIVIEYVDTLDDLRDNPIKSNNHRSGRPGKWDGFVRGAGAPPIKTDKGWLLLYHGMDPRGGPGYKVGAMLLDLKDPTKILYRSDYPILEPDQWYENDWKPGVIYASGAVVFGNNLFVYYGGGDKYVAVAKAPLREFLRQLTHHEHATLKPVKL